MANKGKLDPSVRQLLTEKHRRMMELVNEFKVRRRKLDEDAKKLDARQAQLDVAEEAIKRERGEMSRQLAEAQAKATQDHERMSEKLESINAEKDELEKLVNQILEALQEIL